MPRNHAPGPSTFRNRNRVTNKTRLRVIKGNVEADPLAFDEDEEKARVVSTAGVDAEDANEHHLQVVLSAASLRNQTIQRTTRGAEKVEKHEAFIPIPDNTGVVDDYEGLYPSDKWTDPNSFIKTSATIEEVVSAGIIDGFSYFMDERDKEWLDKNNEEARGEGTSVQGAVSISGIRTSQRSAKARGKEPDHVQPIVISEDEFELVMGIFEKVTHDKTPFLHHGLTEGSPFPSFADYQDAFSSPLQPSLFAIYVVPSWLPSSTQMLRIAKAVYPYWKERRIERGGHRIIPTLNFDESDVKNESYICFRRRDVKAMRKTRASQASSSEKLLRLQQELLICQELSKSLCAREELKREVLQSSLVVWDGREKLASLKRRFPSIGSKEDDDILVDKERPLKKTKAPEPKLKIPIKLSKDNSVAPATVEETIMKPRDRQIDLAKRIDEELKQIRDRDLMWEDALDNSYQSQPTTHGQRLFKFVQENPSSVENSSLPSYRAVRTRRGRGGVLRIDRRFSRTPGSLRDEDFIKPVKHALENPSSENEDELRERAWRLRSQWMCDNDDDPTVGPDGLDEQDRVLADEFDPKIMRKTMRLFTENDNAAIQTDPTIYWTSADGSRKREIPFRIGAQFQIRRDQQVAMLARQQALLAAKAQQAQAQAQHQSQIQGQPPSSSPVQQMTQQVNGSVAAHAITALPVQTPIRRTPSSITMRVSNGSMRPPATPTAPPVQSVTPVQSSPPHVNASPGANGVDHEPRLPSTPHTPHITQDISPVTGETTGTSMNSPLSSKLAHHTITMPNGYLVNSYPPLSNGSSSLLHSNGQMNLQQLSAYMNVGSSRPAAYLGHVTPNGVNYNISMASSMNIKLPAARPMQWSTTQSSNGSVPSVSIAHARSPLLHQQVPHTSPPRPSQSPSVQHQQVVTGAQGY